MTKVKLEKFSEKLRKQTNKMKTMRFCDLCCIINQLITMQSAAMFEFIIGRLQST